MCPRHHPLKRKGPKLMATDPATAQAPPETPAGARQAQVHVDDSKVVGAYANFCRVTGTPEELIIDFGLNSQPMGVPNEPIEVSQRLIINYFTAKRLLGALQMSVQRHEAAFGVLETDVQRRVLPSALRQSS
jgi:hypothetical protein